MSEELEALNLHFFFKLSSFSGCWGGGWGWSGKGSEGNLVIGIAERGSIVCELQATTETNANNCKL